ncbi:MAG TPA: transcription antitermination factor NusB, partial [Holophaga sp.]|nr:transcription antitermination factor NusB [Holophaga sp.]
MGVRRRGREYALQMLYAMDLTSYPPDEVFAGFYAIQDLNRDAFYYARRLVDGVFNHLDEIDAVLTRFAEHWKIHRMAAVDRNLLRLGIYELMYLKEIPFPIIINEALEIVKE